MQGLKHRLAEEVTHLATELFDHKLTDSNRQSLNGIIFGTMKIWRTAHSQRADFPFFLPKDGMLDEDRMDDENGGDESELEGRGVAVGLFPVLIKRGDEKGENLSCT